MGMPIVSKAKQYKSTQFQMEFSCGNIDLLNYLLYAMLHVLLPLPKELRYQHRYTLS